MFRRIISLIVSLALFSITVYALIKVFPWKAKLLENEIGYNLYIDEILDFWSWIKSKTKNIKLENIWSSVKSSVNTEYTQ